MIGELAGEAPAKPRFRVPIWLWLAAIPGSIHALVSLYWLCGGQWLLETVGTRIVETFRGQMWLLIPVVIVKFAVALLPVWLHRRGWPLAQLTRSLSWLSAIVLICYGGFYTAAANLILAEVVTPDPHYDRVGMIGHAWIWDPLFFSWGVLLIVGLVRTRRRTSGSRASRGSDTTPA